MILTLLKTFNRNRPYIKGFILYYAKVSHNFQYRNALRGGGITLVVDVGFQSVKMCFKF